jgi:ankyrin repeat protein
MAKKKLIHNSQKIFFSLIIFITTAVYTAHAMENINLICQEFALPQTPQYLALEQILFNKRDKLIKRFKKTIHHYILNNDIDALYEYITAHPSSYLVRFGEHDLTFLHLLVAHCNELITNDKQRGANIRAILSHPVIQIDRRRGLNIVNMRSAYNETSLHFAAHADIALALIENGAEVNARNDKNQTRLKQAKIMRKILLETTHEESMQQYQELVTVLRAHGAIE